MRKVEFSIVCAWGRTAMENPKRDLLNKLLRKPFPGITPSILPESTFGFWVNQNGLPTVESGITAGFIGTLEDAHDFASMIAIALHQKVVQITIRNGIELKDKQLIFPFTGTKEETLRSLMTSGITGATVLKDELLVNIPTHKSLEAYRILKEVCKCDGTIENITFINHSPAVS